jgi:signal transduction histidine kinase
MRAIALNAPRAWAHRSGAGIVAAAAPSLLLAAAVFATSLACIEFMRSTGSIAALWPANAIVLAALLRDAASLKKDRCSLFLGSLAGFMLAHVVAGDGLLLTLALSLAPMAEVATAVWLVNGIGGGAVDLGRMRSLVLFVLLAGGIAPIVGATLGAAAVKAADWLPWSSTWVVWYSADALANIIVVPFALTLSVTRWRALHLEKRILEAAAVLAVIVLVAAFASYQRQFLFIVVPMVLFAILRFGVAGAAVSTFTVALFSSVFVIQGIGPNLLPETTFPQKILGLQIFLAAVALWSLPVAAMLAERERLLTEVSAAKAGAKAGSKLKSRVLVALRRRLLNAQEEERLRLARELHDQTGQDLVAAMLELGEIECSVAHGDCQRLRNLRAHLDKIGVTLRRVAWELRPTSIDDLGLVKAIENHLADWSVRFGIKGDFHCTDTGIDSLPDDVRTMIFRVVQEALTNVAKHVAGATMVSVVIHRAAEHVSVIIEDDGCGLHPDLAKDMTDEGGLGLAGMRERLSLIDGELKVESSAGAGTTVIARIRLNEVAS